MPLAIAAWDARATRCLAAAAIAMALQCVLCALILHEAVAPAALPASTPLEVTLFSTPARRPRPKMFPSQHLQEVPPSRYVTSRKFPGKHLRRVAPSSHVTPQKRAPIDWQQAMQGEVHDAESRSRHNGLNFGFPQLPAAIPAAPPFGWDYAATHRVQALPEGGVLIMLNDHCALVIFVVFPIAGCKIGRIPANGQLFENVHDPRNDRPGALP